MYRLDKDFFVFQSSMWQTNSVVYQNEAICIVVDPTYFPTEIRIIANTALKSRSFNKYLIFTHSDFDHIVGYQYFNGFTLVGQEGFQRVDREAQIIQLTELDETYYVSRDKEFIFPEIQRCIDTRTEIPLAHDELILEHAPGHTEDGLFLVSMAKKILIAGDYLSDLEFPFIYHSFAAYLATLQKFKDTVRELKIETVIPGHGDFATSQEEIYYRIDTDRVYIEEILDRVNDYSVRGMSTDEILEVLSDISFRGEKISGVLNKMHLENVKKAIKELGGHGGS